MPRVVAMRPTESHRLKLLPYKASFVEAKIVRERLAGGPRPLDTIFCKRSENMSEERAGRSSRLKSEKKPPPELSKKFPLQILIIIKVGSDRKMLRIIAYARKLF